MSAVYGFGLKGLLPHDYTREQIIGNIRLAVRLGFCTRIVEVIDGKPLEFTFADGEVVIDEVEGAEAEIVSELWNNNNLLSIDYDDWSCIAPDAASVFLPSAVDFFEQLDNITVRPTYVESIGNVLERIKVLLEEIEPQDDAGFISRLTEYKTVFETALKFGFIISVSS
jgi:hypothetical protein